MKPLSRIRSSFSLKGPVGPRRSRAGLAPLELVISLPVLLGLMGLMINLGTVASWKVRSANIARESVWSTRWPRGAAASQRLNWPAFPTGGVAQGQPLAVLDDPSVDLPVVRGPALGGTQVNRNLLDPTRGMLQGTATFNRVFPLLPRMLGNFTFRLRHPLLDDGWQYPRMGMRSNWQRREPVIYNLAKADPALVQRFVGAVVAIYFAPFRPQLDVLDRDQEIFAWYGSYHDFHPRLSGFCSLDKKMVHDSLVLPLVDRIQSRRDPRVPGVPENLARFFIGMYQSQINSLQARQDALSSPNPGITAQIGALRGLVGQLQSFLRGL